MRILLFIAVASLISVSGYAQEYFQQQVDYRIQVALDDDAHTLAGQIEMDYYNNAPSALDTLYIHLWPNAYSSRNTELGRQLRESGDLDLEFSTAEERGNISGLQFKVDGREVPHSFWQGHEDIAYVLLDESLAPGARLTLSTPFQVKIPVGKFSRMGHIGQSYQITQWYPKPAVFDKDGWHPIPYLNQGEFYSEFGSFDVSITVPENYVVAATGQLQNTEEFEFLAEKAEETSRGGWKDKTNEFPASAEQTKTLQFLQGDVHDFAWFADKRFNLLHQEFSLDGSGKKVQGWVYFTNNHAEAWSKSMEYVIDGTKHYSRLVGDYPYAHVSVVDGTLSAGGGMEYPMITVINGTSNALALEQVVVHEIGHNWFYGILGSNERDNPWMDEGINSYYEIRYFREKYPERVKRSTGMLQALSGASLEMDELAYRYSACRHQDQPLSTHSQDYSSINYGTMVYMKGAKVMEHLSGVLGQGQFDHVMQTYYQDWKFAHPGPDDMQVSLERSLDKDLDWFFNDLVRDNVKMDHRVYGYDKENHSLNVKSTTSYEGPIPVDFLKDGEVVDSAVGEGREFEVRSDTDFDQVLLDAQHRSLQLHRRNDLLNTRGPLKTWQVPEFHPGIGLGISERPAIYYSPAIGWNTQDGTMLGLYLSNTEILFKNLEWSLLPMYAFRSEEPVGMAHIRKTFWTSETGPGRLDLSVGAKHFSLEEIDEHHTSYSALESRLAYIYQDPSLKEGKHTLALEVDFISFNIDSKDASQDQGRDDLYAELGYGFEKNLGLTRNAFHIALEGHEDFQKLTAEASIEQIYDKNKNKVKLRVYAGKMWVNPDATLIPLGARLSLSGTSGRSFADGTSDDYRYEDLFLSRTADDGFRSQQIVRDRGGFVQSTFYGYSDDWLVSANAEFDLPLPLPLSVYGNLGIYDAGSRGGQELFETGVRLTLIDEICDLSFPLFQSEEIKTFYESRDVKYGETIRLQFRLELLSLRSLIDNMKF